MELILYEGFAKRKNSTKRPTAAGTSFDVKLKQPTSLQNPTFMIRADSLNLNYNYCKFNDDYYYIDDIILSLNNIYEIVCSMDELASHKEIVGNTTAMILRSSTGYNVWLEDSSIYASTQKTEVRQVAADPVVFSDTTGCFLISVVNKFGGGNGFACQYYDTQAGLATLANSLNDADIITDLMKQFSNVNNAFISIKWMPFNYSSISSASDYTELKPYYASNVQLDGGGYRIKKPNFYTDGSSEITIPWRSDLDYRESTGYTSMKLLVPMYGLLDLNASDFVGATKIIIQYRVDMTTGDVVLIINKDVIGSVIQTISFNVAVDIPITTQAKDATGLIQSTAGILTTAASIASDNVVGGIMGAISTVTGITKSLNGRSISYKGSLQGKAVTAYGNKFQLILSALHTADPTRAEHIATIGRPVQAVDLISNHPGYVQTANASVQGALRGSDIDKLNSMLDAGIYYE